MPVTFTIANHAANPVKWAPGPEAELVHPDLDKFLLSCAPRHTKNCQEILQTSFRRKEVPSMIPKKNGLVHTILDAYNQHHHLQLRPDDVWMAIVSQFSFYVNAHAEDLRDLFVAHEGKKTLVVRRTGNRYTIDFGPMAVEMTTLMDQFIVDAELKDWILPKFSTTTPSDTIIYAIQMMATLKAYFEYVFELDCGIPTITLLGEKADWEALLGRIEKFHSFGQETQKWVYLLTPILTRFVEAFDGKMDIDFWGRMVDVHINGSGPTFLTGWITAFCFWDADGKLMFRGYEKDKSDIKKPDDIRSVKVVEDSWYGMKLTVDGQAYECVRTGDIPQAYCDVPVILNDNGEQFDTTMIAGHLATTVLQNPTTGAWDTLRPAPGWFMFIEGDGSAKVPGAKKITAAPKPKETGSKESKAGSNQKGKKGGSSKSGKSKVT